ncbi:MAG: hypothetical protein N3C57_04050 [Aquificaceae bacterium]|nr:hypothetical protein [Aquificaceae bacterium]
MEDYIELYPGNWLYNAGVVGLLRVLSNIENSSDYFDLKEDGSFVIRRGLLEKAFQDKKFEKVPLWHYWYLLETSTEECDKKVSNIEDFKNLVFRRVSGRLFAKNGIYQNYYPPIKLNEKPDEKSGLDYFVEYIGLTSGNRVVFHRSILGNSLKCDFCLSTEYKVHTIDGKFLSALMPSFNMPNFYWICSQDGLDRICSLCQFLIIHQHLAFTKIHDGSEIFINAPSFKLMYELNKLVKELYSGKGKSKSVRKILGMTLIEYSRRLWFNLGRWSQMNIEVVIRRGDVIDFYSLPYHTAVLLSDREIASLISSISEDEILDHILNGEYERILDNVYSEMRKHFGNKAKGKKEKIETFKLEKKLKLYSTIKEKSYV